METSLSLLKRLQLGDDGQDWVAFCELYHPLLMNWCKRQVGNIEDTEDVVQNVFMDIFRNIKHFKHDGKPGTFRAYLKRILRSKVSNLYR
jgi:RNA polymerase sigma-70 factor (ECF subfamily)